MEVSFPKKAEIIDLGDMPWRKYMSERKNNEMKKKYVEEAWLDFFNQVLLKKGIITKEDYQRMTAKIQARNSSR